MLFTMLTNSRKLAKKIKGALVITYTLIKNIKVNKTVTEDVPRSSVWPCIECNKIEMQLKPYTQPLEEMHSVPN